MKSKHGENTRNRGDSRSKSAKTFFWVLLLVVGVLTVSAAVVNFDKFLQVAVPILVFIAGICWALRTTNAHQYEATERSMETYIYLYSDEMKVGYRRIIENHNQNAKEDLDNARLLSYAALYLFFSVVFIIAAEMFVLIFYGHPYCYFSQCRYVWCAAVISTSLSCLFLITSVLSLGIRLSIFGKAKFKKHFKLFSACFANNTYMLKEDWIKFYREDDLYCKKGESEELRSRRRKLRWKLSQSEKMLERIIWEDNWLRDLFMKN